MTDGRLCNECGRRCQCDEYECPECHWPTSEPVSFRRFVYPLALFAAASIAILKVLQWIGVI